MPKVIIVGNGVADMSAANELVERRFRAEVFERNHHYVDDKVRTVDAPCTNTIDPALFLAGEYGFAFFQLITDTPTAS